jgi:hypothetical protein
MGDIFTGAFWRDTAERIVRSVGQGFLTGLGGGAGIDLLGSTDIRALPLWAALFSSAGMAVLTLATCLAAGKVGDGNDASLRRAPGDA